MGSRMEMATETATGILTKSVGLRPGLTATLSRSEGKTDVPRLFRPSRAAFRRHAGPAISVSRAGTPGSPGVSLLRDRGESGIPVADCAAGNGQDHAAVSPAGQVRSHGPHCVPVSDTVQLAGVHAVPAGGNRHRE